MTQSEIREEMFSLLDDIDTTIGADLKDETAKFNLDETISHLFFIRAIELYQGILTLFRANQAISATVLLRALSETFILMKASMREEDFNDRHCKKAILNKEYLIKKAIKYLPDSGFGKDKAFFEEMQAETQKLYEGLEKCLADTFQLFERHEELPIYMQIYAPASLYVHSNRQSFSIYCGENNSIIPIEKRDLSGRYLHTGFSAALLIFKTYELYCELLKKKENSISKIEAKMELSRKKVEAASKI